MFLFVLLLCYLVIAVIIEFMVGRQVYVLIESVACFPLKPACQEAGWTGSELSMQKQGPFKFEN